VQGLRSYVDITALSLKCCYLDMFNDVLDGIDRIERILMELAMELVVELMDC
jgi:hypothetical protein